MASAISWMMASKRRRCDSSSWRVSMATASMPESRCAALEGRIFVRGVGLEFQHQQALQTALAAAQLQVQPVHAALRTTGAAGSGG
jgi:hypothetical protein